MASDKKSLNNEGITQSDSPSPKQEQSKTQADHNQPSSLVKQSSSIYSLTLEEFQQNLFDNGKNLGLMNMDEFLNICTAEETNQQNPQSNNPNQQNPQSETKKINPKLTSQGSLTIPTLLSLKTVEEVWSEMNRDQQQLNEFKKSGNTHRQSTFGEMTLEDFLIKAGVVRGNFGGTSSSSQGHQLQSNQLESVQTTQSTYPIYQSNSNTNVDSGFGFGPTSGLGFSGNNVSSGGGFTAFPQTETGFQGGMWSGGGYGSGPVSPGGLGASHVFNSVSQFELEIGGVSGGKRGRKRVIEGPVEKVVERRQRRMIKNREAASRSRARKQAYTVELEAALDKLKEENARLNQTLLQGKKQKPLQKKMPRITERLKLLRRMWSFPVVECFSEGLK